MRPAPPIPRSHLAEWRRTPATAPHLRGARDVPTRRRGGGQGPARDEVAAPTSVWAAVRRHHVNTKARPNPLQRLGESATPQVHRPVKFRWLGVTVHSLSSGSACEVPPRRCEQFGRGIHASRRHTLERCTRTGHPSGAAPPGWVPHQRQRRPLDARIGGSRSSSSATPPKASGTSSRAPSWSQPSNRIRQAGSATAPGSRRPGRGAVGRTVGLVERAMVASDSARGSAASAGIRDCSARRGSRGGRGSSGCNPVRRHLHRGQHDGPGSRTPARIPRRRRPADYRLLRGADPGPRGGDTSSAPRLFTRSARRGAGRRVVGDGRRSASVRNPVGR